MTQSTINGISLDIFESGAGKPLLYLHDERGVVADAPYLGFLARDRRVLALSLPGFGKSDLPFWMDSADDIAHVCLDLLDNLGLKSVDLVGCSFGGWVAAELASKVPERISRMVLCAPYGVKLGPSDRLDIPDVFAMSLQTLTEKSFHDPARWALNPATLSDADATAIARSRESFALFGWEPYLHNPKLRHRLHRVNTPTLFLRGESDGLVSADYIAGYAKLVRDGRVTHIPATGHYPHIEAPETFAAHVLNFVNGGVA